MPGDWRGRARLTERGADDFAYFFAINHALPVLEVEKLVGASLRDWVERLRAFYERYPADPTTRAMYLDVKNYLADHIHAKVDSTSMAVSLEVRVPFMDYRVAELAGRIPASLKVRDGAGKWILKQLARKWMPADLIDQRKIGFDPPLSNWIFSDGMAAGLGELARPDARFRRYFNGATVDRWRQNLSKGGRWRVPQRSMLFAIYQFERWLKMQEGMPAAQAQATQL